MILLQLIAAYLILFSAGLGATLLILRGVGRLNLLECGCLAWLFGTGIVSLLLWICGTFASGLALQAVVTIVCLALGVMGWRASQRAGAKFALPRPHGAIEWFLAILIVIEVATMFFVSCKHTLGWDGLLNWEIKARYAFLNGGVIPAAYYSDAGRAFSHPKYPLGIPFTELWLYLWIGEPHQFWGKTIFPAFYAAGAALLALLAARLSGRRWIGLLLAALLPFIPFLTQGPGGVIVAYADFPLSVFYLTALGYLLYSLDKNELHPFLIYSSCLALLPWVKHEGVILWFVLVLLGLVVSWSQKKLRVFFLALGPSLLLLGSWRLYLKLMHVASASDFALPTLRTLHDNVNRTLPIIRVFLAEIVETSHWSIFWLLTGLALVYLLFLLRNMRSLLLASAILLPIIIYSSTYLFSTWPSYTAHMTSSFPRLLLHVVPAAWLAIGLVLPLPKSDSLKVRF
ncbi:MAG TPA: hypothetical protein VGQ95_10600 [Chthoniobacterales bacterium]|nr:hypothetical protein [Chthoniobacterales bacterium]